MGNKDEKRRKAKLQRLAEAGRELVPSREAELARRLAQKVAGAAAWPVIGAWLKPGWEQDQLAVAAVARRRPDGAIAAATLLVDLGCMGLKNADVRPHLTEHEWADWLEHLDARDEALLATRPETVAAIYAAGTQWARRWGFQQHPLLPATALFLGGIGLGEDTIPVGTDGKPAYTAGPYDDVEAILAHLDRVAGPGNYLSVIPSDELGGPR